MKRKEIEDFLETLYFHGYIDHDITKLNRLIDDYFPKELLSEDDNIKCESCKSIIDNECYCKDCYNYAVNN
jgi:hypothetical protein